MVGTTNGAGEVVGRKVSMIVGAGLREGCEVGAGQIESSTSEQLFKAVLLQWRAPQQAKGVLTAHAEHADASLMSDG